MTRFCSIIDVLLSRSAETPERPGYSFIRRDGSPVSLTYGELANSVRDVAATLIGDATRNARAILMYPNSVELVVAMYGCMAAGFVPVPVYPLVKAKVKRGIHQLLRVIADAQCGLILTNRALASDLHRTLVDSTKTVRILTTDDIPTGCGKDFEPVLCVPESLALLQYTSGSTALPRGVRISHGNLIANSMAIRDTFSCSPDTGAVSWLPPYHDMGLIGGIFQPLFAGFQMTFMSPFAFVQDPIRWLRAISETKATISPSPNFGYELCTQRVPPEAMADLDLSHWSIAICGAEPVRASTLQRFAHKFAPAGFRMQAFRPSYGLAEATLLVAATSSGGLPAWHAFDREALESGLAIPSADAGTSRVLVGNGRPVLGVTAKIVNPATFHMCPDGSVGEVWVAGAGVSEGYWDKGTSEESIFRAQTAGSEDSCYLRTGDLGFIHNGELFITGRLKDLIIIRGRNHHAEDLEQLVRASHESLKDMLNAVFSMAIEEEEMLVVLQEVPRSVLESKVDLEELISAVNQALAEESLRPDAVVLLKPGSIPRTSSGKVQRYASRNDFMGRHLAACAQWTTARFREAIVHFNSILQVPRRSDGTDSEL